MCGIHFKNTNFVSDLCTSLIDASHFGANKTVYIQAVQETLLNFSLRLMCAGSMSDILSILYISVDTTLCSSILNTIAVHIVGALNGLHISGIYNRCCSRIWDFGLMETLLRLAFWKPLGQ